MSTKQKEKEFREALSKANTSKDNREAVMLLPDYKPSTTDTDDFMCLLRKNRFDEPEET